MKRYKMATKTKRDPLSRYFQDLNESDLDSDENADEENDEQDFKTHVSTKTDIINKPNIDSGQIKGSNSTSEKDSSTTTASATPAAPSSTSSVSNSTTQQTAVKNKPPVKKLPSAHECLRSENKPDFLKLNQRQEVNWDVSFKTLEGDNAASTFGAGDYRPNAVPPPSSYEPITDPGIKVVDSEGKKRKTAGDPEDESSSRKAYRVEERDL